MKLAGLAEDISVGNGPPEKYNFDNESKIDQFSKPKLAEGNVQMSPADSSTKSSGTKHQKNHSAAIMRMASS